MQYITANLHGEVKDKIEAFQQNYINPDKLHIMERRLYADELCNNIRYFKETTDVEAVFIDYMQQIKLSPDSKKLSRQEELKEICLMLKDVAIETQLPLILAAQFNREVTDPQKMHVTKIGEAGDIERIASLVVGMWDCRQPPTFSPKDNKDLEQYKTLVGVGKDAENLRKEIVLIQVLKNRTGISGGIGRLSIKSGTGFYDSNITETSESVADAVPTNDPDNVPF